MAFIISHKYKFVYCHIPKTGGTSICYLKNQNLGSLDNLLGEEDIVEGHQHISFAKCNGYQKWCNVREPLDRAVSIYHDQAQLYFGNVPFDKFCAKIKENGPFWFNQVWWPQSWFISDESGELLVDNFILFDNYENEVKRFYDSIGVDAAVQHLKTSERKPKECYYTQETENIIREAYSDDFKLYEKVRKCKRT